MSEKKDDVFGIDKVAYSYNWRIIGWHKKNKDQKFEENYHRATIIEAKKRFKEYKKQNKDYDIALFRKAGNYNYEVNNIQPSWHDHLFKEDRDEKTVDLYELEHQLDDYRYIIERKSTKTSTFLKFLLYSYVPAIIIAYFLNEFPFGSGTFNLVGVTAIYLILGYERRIKHLKEDRRFTDIYNKIFQKYEEEANK